MCVHSLSWGSTYRLLTLLQALRLVKTNHDVHVEVSDKVDLQGLPTECNLMAISNKWGILAAGSNNGKSVLQCRDKY